MRELGSRVIVKRVVHLVANFWLVDLVVYVSNTGVSLGQDEGPFAAKEDALDHASLPAPHSQVEKRGIFGAEVALAQELDAVLPNILLFQEPLREPLFVLAPEL
jgi:hypothetical protein